ncbi:MAG: M28 family peptidase, partial [Bacteroidales bacterium]|nr:M28 family peptidase [Bacteroidales bacterium]
MLKKIFILSILHVFVIFLYSQSAIERLQKDVIILSSDSFEGRLPFSRGDSLATNYILEEFHKQQLTLYNNTGKQEISFPHQRIILPSELIINETSYQFKRDFIPYSFSKNTKFESDAIFAGYGLFVRTKDSILINHFANADVKGRWVIMFDGKPDGFAVNPSQYKVFTKCSNARILGAKGVILVSNQNILPEQNTKDLFELPFPVINITHDVFIDICKLNNLDYEQLIQQINQKIFFEAIPLHCTIKANVQIKTLDGKSNNIIGITTGSDPKLKEEYIVAGAHFDHLGSTAIRYNSTFINEIHNGADDNASGVAGMLELMRLVQQMPTKRSIIWVAFAAEEKGL